MNRFRNPLAISTVVVWRRSSVWVMCPMIEMCALVARAGAVRVSSASGRPSHAERSVGDSVEISRHGGLQHGRELGLDHEQSLVGGAGVVALRVADGPDQSLAAGEAGRQSGR